VSFNLIKLASEGNASKAVVQLLTGAPTFRKCSNLYVDDDQLAWATFDITDDKIAVVRVQVIETIHD